MIILSASSAQQSVCGPPATRASAPPTGTTNALHAMYLDERADQVARPYLDAITGLQDIGNEDGAVSIMESPSARSCPKGGRRPQFRSAASPPQPVAH